MSARGSALGFRSPRRGDVPLAWLFLDAVVWVFRGLRLHRLGPVAGYVMVAPAILAVGSLAAGVIYLTWTAFHEFDAFLNVQGGLSTENFTQAFASEYHRKILFRTLYISVLVTILAVIIAMPLAYTMVRSRSRWIRMGLLVAVFVPFLVGEVVRAYGWLVLISANGLVAWLTDALGLGSSSLLGTPYGVTIGLLQLMVPLCALVLLPAIHAIDPELEQASTVMGARPRHTWFHVIIPLARRGLVSAAAVSFTLCMTVYATPSLLGNGQFDFNANAIKSVYFTRGNSHLASAMGFIVLIVTLVCVGLIFWFGTSLQARSRRRQARLYSLTPDKS